MPNLKTPVNAFKTGNQLYKLASYTGRNKLFATPDDLLAAAFDYFDWVENNPVIEEVFVDGKTFPLPKMRAMSLERLCLHIGVCNLRHYKKNADFSQVISFIYSSINAYNLEGAAAGLLKLNIISRLLGL